MIGIEKLNGKIIQPEQLKKWIQYPEIKQLYDRIKNFNKIQIKLSPYFLEKIKPDCGLNGMDHFNIMKVPEGLNKPINEEEYKAITNEIINEIKTADDHWKKTWKTKLNNGEKGYLIAYRWDKKIPYKGFVNQAILGVSFLDKEPLSNPYYLTESQIKKAGGKLKKHAKPKPAYFYNVLYRILDDKKHLDFKTYDREKMREYIRENIDIIGIKEDEIEKYISYRCTIPYMKKHFVFNGADVEGIDFKLDEKQFKGEIGGNISYKRNKKIPEAEAIIKAYPNPVPKIVRKEQDRAYYDPNKDEIVIPLMRQFTGSPQYYGTLFHELIHSTGHPTRLNRKFGKRFGDKDYAFEELISEIGASYLSALSGFLHDNIKNSAAYLKGWRRSLIKSMKDDPKFFVMAAAKAQKAVDYIIHNLPDDFGKIKAKNNQNTTKRKTEHKDTNIDLSNFKNFLKSLSQLPETKKHTVLYSVSYNGEVYSLPKSFNVNGKEFNTDFHLGRHGKHFSRNHKFFLDSKLLIEYGPSVDPEAVIRRGFRRIYKQLKEKGLNIPGENNHFSHDNVVDIRTLKTKTFQKWDLKNEPLSRFLGDIERKKEGSIAVTLDAPQGAGKTRMLFQFADMFARNGYKVLFLSLEEHPVSRLFVNKLNEYISPEAEKNIFVAGEIPDKLNELIEKVDVILIDSWNKYQKEFFDKTGEKPDFDYHLRKRYNGKLFIVVFQRTQEGKMRGGSQAQFDGDIILKIHKDPENFQNNYVYYDKNRYMIDNYKWNVFERNLIENGKKN